MSALTLNSISTSHRIPSPRPLLIRRQHHRRIRHRVATVLTRRHPFTHLVATLLTTLSRRHLANQGRLTMAHTRFHQAHSRLPKGIRTLRNRIPSRLNHYVARRLLNTNVRNTGSTTRVNDSSHRLHHHIRRPTRLTVHTTRFLLTNTRFLNTLLSRNRHTLPLASRRMRRHARRRTRRATGRRRTNSQQVVHLRRYLTKLSVRLMVIVNRTRRAANRRATFNQNIQEFMRRLILVINQRIRGTRHRVIVANIQRPLNRRLTRTSRHRRVTR